MFSQTLASFKAQALAARMHCQRLAIGRSLRLIKEGQGFADAKILAVIVARNEKFRLEYVIDYHRKLGVEHFVVIDNESTDSTLDLLGQLPNVTCFSAVGSYKKAACGAAWVNFIASKYLQNRWVVILDADELFVYPRMDELSLGDLTDRLDRLDCHALNGVMVDLYGSGELNDSSLGAEADPLDVLRHFDKSGYERRYVAEYDVYRITGGPRRRSFFANDEKAPTLNKTPLVKWRKHYLLVHSCHVLWPYSLNRESEHKAGGLSGALLHLKLSADFLAKTAEEAQRGEHTAEYQAYNSRPTDTFFDGALSVRYDDWRSLRTHRLVSEGSLSLAGEQSYA